MAEWECVLELDTNRQRTAGSEGALVDAVRNAADLRVYTEFLHNEHIDTESDSNERIREVAEFGITYLLEESWVAGIMSLRQPISLPVGFGPRSSMSFFLYNQNGQQAIARPHLDGMPASGEPGPSAPDDHSAMAKMNPQTAWDGETNSPSHNFIYDFEVYRFNVCDGWREVLSHDAEGAVVSGSIGDLTDAFSQGCEIKAGVRGLCSDLAPEPGAVPDHEVFVQAGSCYYYTERELFIAGTHPLVRVAPAVPMLYRSHGWDFGWLMLRTDGFLVYRRCDPYTFAFQDVESTAAIRWFVR